MRASKAPNTSNRSTDARPLATAAAVGLALLMTLGAAGSAAAAGEGYRLNRARSCRAVHDQLVDRIVEQLMQRRHRPPRVYRRRGMPVPSRAPLGAAKSRRAEGAADEAARSAGPSHFTGTNNQVVGVDEADRVKTDGRFIYTVHGAEVLIIKSWPARATGVIARIKPGATPRQLFVNGDKLVVLSSARTRAMVPRRGARRRSLGAFQSARATIYDIRERTSPRLLAHVDLQGSLLRARMIGTEIYMVTNSQLRLPSSFWSEVNRVPSSPRPYRSYRHPTIPSTAQLDRARLRRRVRRALARVSADELLPRVRFTYTGGRPPAERALLGCSDLYFPASGSRSNYLGLITLSHMSLRGGRVNAAAVSGSGVKLYASRDNIYIAAQNVSLGSGQRGTQIHKFALGRRSGAPRYAASGAVPGYLLNQFAMDEHRGDLRVATTDNGWSRSWRWRGRAVRGQASNVFVLRQRQGELATVGAVRGLAPGERIYAVRMMGERGYVVTFRRTDPLYTLDLSRPRKPRVLGELKVPGFSSYIHPMGQGKLLTVGQDADERGRVQGAHLQIFDVSDMRNPRRVHHYKLTLGSNSSSSAAQWDHHAFTYNRRTRTLALPLTVRRYHKGGGNFNGVILVKVDARRGFVNLGDVEHADLARRTRCMRSSSCGPTTRYWNAPVQRSIFMDDKLYTLSSYGLKVSQLGQRELSTVASVLFASPARHAWVR